MLRVVQEALANAVKHARATRREVRVHEDRGTGMLCVEVTDDGIGPGPGAQVVADGEGRGLHNIRERARSLRGDLEVSPLERGTCVRLKISSVSEPEPDADRQPD